MALHVAPLWLQEITLAPEPQSVSTARRFVREHLILHGLPLLVDDITLVASELATNVVQHAGTPFTMTISASEDAVILAVEDGSDSVPIRRDAQVNDATGRGIAIMGVVSREWGVVVNAGSGKSVWAAFDLA